MSLELFDTHCHLNLREHFPDPDEDVERAWAAGVTRLAVVGIDLESCARALALAERHEGVYAIIGWHPISAAEFSDAGLNQISDMLAHPKVVAVGEIGLDYHWDFATPDQQRACLLDQLALAEELGKPVVFHCREAYDDLLGILEARPPRPYLFHCFSGDAVHAERILSLDAWIGVDGPLTYKKSDGLRSLVQEWPRSKLVLETDSPYLSPEPHRGRPNHPAYLPLINQRLAACWNVDPEDSASQTTTNACGFFGIER